MDIKFIREQPDAVSECLTNRNNTDINIDAILKGDAARRELLHEVESLRAEQNKASEKIAKSKKAGDDTSDAIAAMKGLSAKVKELGEAVNAAEEAQRQQILGIPNLLHESVPVGKDESANRLERECGTIPTFDFEVRAHVDIGEAVEILDFER